MTGFVPAEVLDATEALCRQEPIAARTRHALLKIEREGQRAGWRSEQAAPTVFVLESHPTNHHVTCWRDEVLTSTLALCRATMGSLAAAMMMLAGSAEKTRALMSAIGAVMPTQDLLKPTREGDAFYGVAVRLEGRMLARAEVEKDWPAVRTGVIAEHEKARDGRFVYCVTRDGLSWVVARPRDREPWAVVAGAEGEGVHAGGVIHALARLTNAVSSGPAAVPPPLVGPFGGAR